MCVYKKRDLIEIPEREPWGNTFPFMLFVRYNVENITGNTSTQPRRKHTWTLVKPSILRNNSNSPLSKYALSAAGDSGTPVITSQGDVLGMVISGTGRAVSEGKGQLTQQDMTCFMRWDTMVAEVEEKTNRLENGMDTRPRLGRVRVL